MRFPIGAPCARQTGWRVITAALCWCSLVNFGLGRIWTDHKGRQVEAEFVAIKETAITLKRTADEKLFDVPLEAFSKKDQAFVARLTRQHTIEKAEIERLVAGAKMLGQGCGGTTFQGKFAGAFWNDYAVHLPGFKDEQVVSVGYIQKGPLFSFSGPGFIYKLEDKKLVLQR